MKKIICFLLVTYNVIGQTNPAVFDDILGNNLSFAQNLLGSKNYIMADTDSDDDFEYRLFINHNDNDAFFAYYKGVTSYISTNREVLLIFDKKTNKATNLNYKTIVLGCEGDCLSSFLSRIKSLVDHKIKPLPLKRSDRKYYTPPPTNHSFNSYVGELEGYVWEDKNFIRKISAHNYLSDIKPMKSAAKPNVYWIDYSLSDKKSLEEEEAFNPLHDYEINDIPYDKPEEIISLYLLDIIYNVYDKDPNVIIDVNAFNQEVYFKDIKTYDNQPDSHAIAIAHKMFDDCGIEIQIDINNWIEKSPIERLWIMYHELSHDAFNIEHNQGGDIMLPYIPNNITKSLFYAERKKLIKYLKLLDFKSNCLETDNLELKKELVKNIFVSSENTSINDNHQVIDNTVPTKKDESIENKSNDFEIKITTEGKKDILPAANIFINGSSKGFSDFDGIAKLSVKKGDKVKVSWGSLTPVEFTVEEEGNYQIVLLRRWSYFEFYK